MDIKKAIRALLQTKFGGAQLSNARVDSLAAKLEGKVTTEEELEQKLSAMDEILPFTEIVKEDDRQRSIQAELDKLKGKPPEPAPIVEPVPTSEQGDANKAVLDAIKALTDTVQGLKGDKVVNDRKSLIQARLKDANEDYSARIVRDFCRMNFADDAAFEEYLSDVEKDFTAHVQTTAESKLGKDAPFVSVGKDGRVNEASQSEIDQLFGEIKI